MGKGESTEKVVRDIQRKTRRHFAAEEKIRIVLEGLTLADIKAPFLGSGQL